MAREFSKKFYKGKAWLKQRDYIYKRDKGLCQDCLEKGKITPGIEVHHIKHLTPDNINNPDITLSDDNLTLLCKECHHRRHTPKREVTREGLMFNDRGELVNEM